MSYWLDPTGHPTYGIGLCARCSRKMYLEFLYDDPNYPGLKVCMEDLDQLDPYRLPPREPDQITLDFIRPDVPLQVPTTPPTAPGDTGWPPADSVSANGSTYLPGT